MQSPIKHLLIWREKWIYKEDYTSFWESFKNFCPIKKTKPNRLTKKLLYVRQQIHKPEMQTNETNQHKDRSINISELRLRSKQSPLIWYLVVGTRWACNIFEIGIPSINFLPEIQGGLSLQEWLPKVYQLISCPELSTWSDHMTSHTNPKIHIRDRPKKNSLLLQFLKIF